jgi:hypothetical protein
MEDDVGNAHHVVEYLWGLSEREKTILLRNNCTVELSHLTRTFCHAQTRLDSRSL